MVCAATLRACGLQRIRNSLATCSARVRPETPSFSHQRWARDRTVGHWDPAPLPRFPVGEALGQGRRTGAHRSAAPQTVPRADQARPFTTNGGAGNMARHRSRSRACPEASRPPT